MDVVMQLCLAQIHISRMAHDRPGLFIYIMCMGKIFPLSLLFHIFPGLFFCHVKNKIQIRLPDSQSVILQLKQPFRKFVPFLRLYTKTLVCGIGQGRAVKQYIIISFPVNILQRFLSVQRIPEAHGSGIHLICTDSILAGQHFPDLFSIKAGIDRKILNPYLLVHGS